MDKDFMNWFTGADIPLQDKDGDWYDAETGFYYKPANRTDKKGKTNAENRYGHLKAADLKKRVDMLINSQKIDIERNSDINTSANKAVVDYYESFSGKITKAQMFDIIEMNSKASRALNAQRNN